MTEQSPRQFLAMIEKGGLAARDKLEAAVANLRKNGASEFSVDQLAAYLIDQKLVTSWHVEKLRAGKYKGFFLGKYKLLRLLGSGGMCSVYLAEHKILGQLRAIKVLPRSRVADKSYLDRFYREGRAAAALNHPNIVRVYDIDNDRDTHYLVMEFVEGWNLYDYVQKQGPLSYAAAADYILQAAIGLQHAHDARMVHRDVKPANLLVTESNLLKVSDLGLALFREDDYSLTIAHNERVLGTADYLAPEQAINSHNVDHRADVYGLGCSLYYLLSGQPPFPQGSLAQRIAMHQTAEPKPLWEYRPDCPIELLDICEKMMRKSPDDRQQSCRELEEEIRKLKWRPVTEAATTTAAQTSAANAAPSQPNTAAPSRQAAAKKGTAAKVAATQSPASAPATATRPRRPESPAPVATPAANKPAFDFSDAEMQTRRPAGFAAQELAGLTAIPSRYRKNTNTRDFWIAAAVIAVLAIILVTIIFLAINMSSRANREAAVHNRFDSTAAIASKSIQMANSPGTFGSLHALNQQPTALLFIPLRVKNELI